MLKKEYYCLVAGLPDLLFNENKLAVNSLNFREELKYQLSHSDYKLVEFLFLPFDNKNLINLLFQQNHPFNSLGIISKTKLEEQLSPTDEEIILPEYMLQFITWMKKRDSKEFSIEAENILHSLYYEFVLTTKNQFLKNWFLFELNTKNILTAFNCIHHNYELDEQLLQVPQNDTVYSLLLNKRLKFELFEDEFPFSDQIFRIAESDAKSIEKEKTLDRIKWDYLDEFTFFHYFTIEKILSFILKLMISERWMKLDTETGRQLLDRLINDLKTSYEFPAEFSLVKKTG
ncbi:DUF2764 family protein [Prolixibacteraceae bacterium Z1-6]|uniref:DUF2764 family protein n=1 Tax=Draconibacterium aestuarii TaxID=2998507 RepID=A0A9X3J3N5_9BACT|nr:DUF2764 family protein [Prolixibacteraceae bacterium Z1-6]